MKHGWILPLALLWPTVAAADGRTWTLASVAPEGSVYADLVADIARIVEEEAPGVRIRRRIGGVLGTESETVDLVAQNRLDLFAGSLGALVERVPDLGVLELPYLFPDAAALQTGMRRLGRGRAAVLQTPCEREHIALISMGGVGWRDIASVGKPIAAPEDLRGLRARTQPAPVHRAMWKAFGAIPTDTSLQDLQAGLSTFDLQVLDVPVTFLIGTSAHERVKSITRTHHTPQIIVLIASKRAWASLSPEKQERIRARVDRAADRIAGRAAELDEELFHFLMARGVHVADPSPTALAAFREASARVEEALQPLPPPQRKLLAVVRGE